MCRRRHSASVSLLAPFFLFSCLILAACGQDANAANCSGNIASVHATGITNIQFNAQLRYALGFYEHGNAGSRFYNVDICHNRNMAGACHSIKSNLVSRMIDQQIVSDYAAAHGLTPTSAEWMKALRAERQKVRIAGGPAAFAAYLAKVGTDDAEYRFLESQQIETANVIRAVGPIRFRGWLQRRESSRAVIRCPLPR
jgi:hypothetical protein